MRLIGLAADGILEIGVPPQGVWADFGGDLTTPTAKRLLTLLGGPGFVELEQHAWPWNVTYPAENFYPRTPVEGFAEAWYAIA